LFHNSGPISRIYNADNAEGVDSQSPGLDAYFASNPGWTLI
jgi:hypothetical protein